MSDFTCGVRGIRGYVSLRELNATDARIGCWLDAV